MKKIILCAVAVCLLSGGITLKAEEQRKSNKITAYSCSDDPKKPSKNPACAKPTKMEKRNSSGGQSGNSDFINKLRRLLSR